MMENVKINDFDCLRKNNKAKKLFVLLHGYGANKEDLFPLSSYLGEQFDYLFPNAPISLSPGHFDSRCWFELDMNRFSFSADQVKTYLHAYRYEDLSPIAGRLGELIEQAGKSYEEIVLGGFSQGSMIALLTSLMIKRPLKALVLMSSHLFMVPKMEHLLVEYPLPPFPIYQTHGQSDPVLPYIGGEDLHKLLEKCGFKVDFQSYAGGHGIDPSHLLKIKAALS